jgi:hypothetical protein
MTAVEDQEAREIQIEALVRRARVLRAEMTNCQDSLKAIESRLDELVEVGWKVEIDGIAATKKPANRSFNISLALEKMSPEEKLECVTTNLNPKKVREWADNNGLTEACMELADDSKTRLVLS